MLRSEIHLIDGENIVARFQAIKAEGRTPKSNVAHKSDTYVWHPELLGRFVGDVVRVSYYTSAVGDEAFVGTVNKEIREFTYKSKAADFTKTSHVVAQVFKKPSKSAKSRSVDINMVIDAMRHVSNGSANLVCIYSGDGDFVPLVKELMSLGAQVHVRALSSGLSSGMETTADHFALLDEVFFEAQT